jgi:hypothetical protein
MSYKTVADIAESYSLVRRLNAGAAKESIDNNVQWVQTYRWELASQPGWDAAWDSAVAGGVADPGSDEAVITDGMILSGVQAVWQANNPDEPPADEA